MGLDIRYMQVVDYQGLLRDKDTGLPLRNGVVYFWKDQARNEAKPVFKISGTPPNYIYTELPNPLELSSYGTFQDPNSNEDIIPYYFPYDDEGNVELYFSEVYSEGGKTSGVLQFTREGLPNIAEVTGPTAESFENFIPNGQFLAHYDLPATDTQQAGEVRENITVIGPGGWTFERSSGTGATDLLTFDRLPNTFDFPRFAIHIKNENAGSGGDLKDLRVKFFDVNKFASEQQKYTFSFSGKTNSIGGTVPVELFLIKNFGTPNGDSPTSRSLGTFGLTNSYPSTPFSIAFAFGTNENKTIGTDNNDFFQLALRFPTNSEFDVSLTDFSLGFGDINVIGYPDQTNADTLTRSVWGGGPIPAADGSTLFLKPYETKNGYAYDYSVIGDIVYETQTSVYVDSLHPTTNRMLPDGKQYETSGYSPLGIPFSRYQKKIYDPIINAPRYGTGPDYFIAVLQGGDIELRFVNNTEGVVTAIADGPIATGFTLATPYASVSSDYNVRAYYIETNKFAIENKAVGACVVPTAGTSGFAIQIDAGESRTIERFVVSTIVAHELPGKYFTFSTPTTSYFVWFTVDGGGSIPTVPGHTPIQVNLRSDYDAPLVANVIREALNNWQISTIRATSGATVPAGSSFKLTSKTSTSTQNYHIWYTVDGVGTEPSISNSIGIKVAILSTDTITQVNFKTQTAINTKYFAAPDLRGAFIRINGSSPWITDWGYRMSAVPGFQNGDYGIFEFDTFRDHVHRLLFSTSTSPEGLTAGITGAGTVSILNTSGRGDEESRPYNINLNAAIIY